MPADVVRIVLALDTASSLSGSGRRRFNGLPLFWAKLYLPRRHVFLEVRER